MHNLSRLNLRTRAGRLAVVATLVVSQAIAFSVAAPSASAVGGTDIIGTIAGLGIFKQGTTGDGSLATSAAIQSPFGVAVGPTGNVYFTDASAHSVRMIDATTGNITTFAGSGTSGFSGDSGPATAAKLNFPWGVAVDGSGNVYISDQANYRIRKVDTNGVITTVAGTGQSGYNGEGILATSAWIEASQGLAVDSSGNLYIAEGNGNRVRKITMSTGLITTLAGTGISGFDGDGVATAKKLAAPRAVAVASDGTVYVADTSNARIRKITSDGNLTTIAGDGTLAAAPNGTAATSSGMWLARGVAVDSSGLVYYSDSFNNLVRRINADGTVTTIAGDGYSSPPDDGGPATSASIYEPGPLAFDGDGALLIGELGGYAVRKTPASALVLTVTRPTGGVITSSEGARHIQCGSGSNAFCTRGYMTGQVITLTATPDTGYAFGGWDSCPSASGNTCTVTMSTATTVSAIFSDGFTYSCVGVTNTARGKTEFTAMWAGPNPGVFNITYVALKAPGGATAADKSTKSTSGSLIKTLRGVTDATGYTCEFYSGIGRGDATTLMKSITIGAGAPPAMTRYHQLPRIRRS